MKYLFICIAALGVTIAFPVEARKEKSKQCQIVHVKAEKHMKLGIEKWEGFLNKSGLSKSPYVDKALLDGAKLNISVAGDMASFYSAFCKR